MTKREWKRRYMESRQLRKWLKRIRHIANAGDTLSQYPASMRYDLLADCYD